VDAGCGPAILSMNLAQRHGIEIIALDLSFVLSRAFQQNRSNLCHFIQCSVLAPPLRPGIADLTYSHGVLHHTQSTRDAFAAIERLTRPGGLLYVWLYGRKRGWNRIKYLVIRAIRGVNSRLPRYPQMVVIYLLTAFHLVIRFLKKLVGIRVEPIDSMSQMLVVTRDRYTPKHAREHTEAEVKGWFAEKGYTGIVRRLDWNTVVAWNGSTDLAIRGIRPR
jgi:SAM-dependent methyltransferase